MSHNFCQAIWTIKCGFHTLVSNEKIVSVAEFFFSSRDRGDHMETLAIVSNDPYVRSESIVPIELRSIITSGLRG